MGSRTKGSESLDANSKNPIFCDCWPFSGLNFSAAVSDVDIAFSIYFSLARSSLDLAFLNVTIGANVLSIFCDGWIEKNQTSKCFSGRDTASFPVARILLRWRFYFCCYFYF